MNDFTRTELASIIDAFKYIKDDPAWRDTCGWDDELEAKINIMLETNYATFRCEHCYSLRQKNYPNAFCCREYKYE
jgi:hypothetical protein